MAQINENATGKFPGWTSTFIKIRESHRTIGQAENCVKVAHYTGDLKNGLPTDKDWKAKVGDTIVAHVTGESKGKNLDTVLPNAQLARSVLLAASTLVGFDDTKARVSSAIFMENWSDVKILFEDPQFRGLNVVCYMAKTGSTKVENWPMFSTLGDLAISAQRVFAFGQFLDTHMGGEKEEKGKDSASEKLVEVESLLPFASTAEVKAKK